jgi:phosphatidate cytidylyltransferase
MEGTRPFDSELDFDHQRRRRPPPPPPLAGSGGGGRRRRPKRDRSETLARIAWVLPWLAAVIVIVIVGDLPFAAAMAVLACVGMLELFKMAPDARPFPEAAFVVAFGLIAAAFFGDQYQLVIAFATLFPLMFVAAVTRRDRGSITISLAFTVFAVAWIAIPFAHAVLLRELPHHGAALLVDVLVATFVADTAAYAGGRMFGRHRLAPELSPNKTLEGLAFGVVGGTLGFWFAGLYQDWLPGLDALAMGFCIAVIAPLGDLFESMIKRDLQIKDSGTIFGPHGGLLDRVDAVLFTIVAGYYLAVAFVY